MDTALFLGDKQYLTGIDWIVHVFDYMNKRATGAGNIFQIVMELDGVPAEDEIRDSLEHCLGTFPVLNGRPRRALNLAPYWTIPLRSRNSGLTLNVHHLENGQDVSPLLEKWATSVISIPSISLLFISGIEQLHFKITRSHCEAQPKQSPGKIYCLGINGIASLCSR